MKIKINGEEIKAEKGSTILEVANDNEVEIPTLCNHPDTSIKGSCRICMVYIKGVGHNPACATKVERGMEIITHNPEIEKIRRVNLELLFSQHKEECNDCVWNSECKLLSLARKYFVKINKFKDRKDDYPELNFGNVIDFDTSKCIDCRVCIDVCPVSFLEMEGRGHKFEVVPNKGGQCVYCGQCINHCPAGAFEADGEFENIENPLDQKNKEIIFQIAPAARVSISEEFGLEPGKVSTGKLITGLRRVGVDKVYDVSFGADFTTRLEAKEFLEKSEDELPMFTSCCPSWVRFIEAYYPEFIDNLTTVRSPHIILGGMIKELNQNPENTIVVSVMPCSSKKYEIQREELKQGGRSPVDYVLTVREVGRLFRDRNISFCDLEPSTFDNPFGEASGDAISYGVSGGVMEAALREAYKIETDKNLKEENIKDKDDFSFNLENREVNATKVSGLEEARIILEKIKNNPRLYDYIEFMTCEGGCIGGGGQPVPTSPKIRRARREGLKRESVKKNQKTTFNNKRFENVYKDLESKENIFYTSYGQKSSSEKIIIK